MKNWLSKLAESKLLVVGLVVYGFFAIGIGAIFFASDSSDSQLSEFITQEDTGTDLDNSQFLSELEELYNDIEEEESEPEQIPAAAPPAEPAAPSNAQEASVQNQSCLIKGNISYNTGEKIYHVPGQAYYDVTVINESAGERWFCSEQEAINAGWRKSKL